MKRTDLTVLDGAEIATRLRSVRKEKGLRQNDVCESAQVNQKTLSQWELGDVPESIPVFGRIALALGLTPDSLLIGTPDETALAGARARLAPDLQDDMMAITRDLINLHAAALAQGPGESPITIYREFLDRVVQRATGKIVSLPVGTTITKDKNVKAYTPPPGLPSAKDVAVKIAKDDAPAYGKPVPVELRPTDYWRQRLKIVHYSTEKAPRTVPVPGWSGLAAGPGRDVEPENPIFMEAAKVKKDTRFFIVRGDSMFPTFKDNEIITVRDLGAGGLVLPPLARGASKSPLDAIKRQVPNDSACLISINNEELTVKRIRYAARSNQDWHLMIMADNPTYTDYPRPTGREDEVIFWAVVEGLAKPMVED